MTFQIVPGVALESSPATEMSN